VTGIIDSQCGISVIITPINSRPKEGRVRDGVAKGFNYVRLGDDEDKYLSVIASSKLVEFSISWWYHRD
jgi:hypothetical protein